MSLGSPQIKYIDSHTAGEPTRVVVEGAPDLGAGSLRERLAVLKASHDGLRRSLIHEPRGWDAIVGALLCEPDDPASETGVIFFNNTGYLGMCGHGAIGVAVTLHYLGRIGLGCHLLETPVGTVEVNLTQPNRVAIENVASYRYRSGVGVAVEGMGTVTGDIAWGGNWFFLIGESPVELRAAKINQLSEAARRIRDALVRDGITGADGAEIDHVEIFGPAVSTDADRRNFVYCPGGAYDRSPCGTGTSAKVACLAADNQLQPGDTWVQESIIGSRFEARYQRNDLGQVIPVVVGEAYICGEGLLVQQANDPFAYGIQSEVTHGE